MLCRDFAQDFAVEGDSTLFEVADKRRKGGAVFASGCVNANLLQCAVVALFELATHIGVDARFRCRCFSDFELGLSSPHHAFGARKNVFAALDVGRSSFDAWHSYLVLVPMRVLIFLVRCLDIGSSRRLLRVTLPASRELKWSCPPWRRMTFPLAVMRKRFATVLFVLSFIVISSQQWRNSSRLGVGMVDQYKGLDGFLARRR